MKKLKEFREVFLIALVISLCFASCKQPQNDKKAESITVTVKKDVHVESVTNSFSLDKGTRLGFSQLKNKISVKFEAGYELAKITLNTADGEEITDVSPHTFDKDTTIFICSQKEGVNEKLELKELEVDGKSINIADIMDAGKTKKEKISIEAKASPADVKVEFEPSLDKDNFWKLEAGKQSLKIKIKKESNTKEYTLNVEKLEADVPLLKKITVGEKSKEGAEITEEMAFTAPQNVSEIQVKTETDPENAIVAFEPILTDGKLTLSTDETTLKVKVGTAPRISKYTVKVKKLVNPSKLINALFIAGGKIQGVQPQASKALREQILNGNKDVTLELNGTIAEITAGSSLKKWKYFKINGKECNFFSAPGLGLTSATFEDIPLPEKGQTIDVKIEVGDEKDEAVLDFKIKRLNETVDVPIDNLIIAGRTAITDPRAFINLANGSKPAFTGYEPTVVELQTKSDVLKTVTINSSSEEIKTKDNEEKKIWYIEKKIEGVSPQGKDILIVIEPKDTENYHTITWSFHLNYTASIPMTVEYKINGKDKFDLDPSFDDGINNNTNPLVEINGNFLNLKLSCGARVKNVKINDETIECENLKADGEFYNLLHSIPIDVSEKNIDITITPYYEGTYNIKKMKFRVKSNGNNENISPYFAEISGDKNLPKDSFKDKLTDGSNPLHQIYGNLAKMVITFTEYEAEFLCKEVKIDNEKFAIKKTVDLLGLVTCKVEKTISVSETTPRNVKIEFVANEGKAENLTWKFQLQGGGTLPSIPQSRMRKFTINGVGYLDNPLPKEFTSHLTDGKNPLHQFDGKKATIELGCYDAKLIEKIEFMMDGEKKADVAPIKQGYLHYSKYTFEINDLQEHLIKLTVYPQDKATYSPLIYSFKLQSTGKKVPLSPITARVGGVIQKSGYKATIKAESVTISVEAESNIIAEVTIGEKEKNEEVCQVEEKTLITGKKIWEAKRDVSLLDNDGNAIEKVFRVIVKPIDTEGYREATYEYIIKGTKVPKDNAEFVFTPKKVPDIRNVIEWKSQTLESKLADDYGVTAVKLVAYTVSSKAKVKYQIIDLNDQPIEGFPENEMANNKGTHTSEKITMFENKPTKIKVWVIAEDGHTTDNKKGLWLFTYNPVPLTWGYEDHEKGAKYTTKAYDTIEIDKTKIGADKKIYLVFAPWNEKSGYTILNEGLPSFQTDCIKLEALGKWQQYYKTSIDVSSLISEPPTQSELEAIFKLQKKGIECINYKIKIKVKS